MPDTSNLVKQGSLINSIIADNDSLIDEQEMENYRKMLGDKEGFWDELVGYLAFPKLRTSHYNENGKNVFYSKITIVFFLLMVISMSVLMIRFFIPLF